MCVGTTLQDYIPISAKSSLSNYTYVSLYYTWQEVRTKYVIGMRGRTKFSTETLRCLSVGFILGTSRIILPVPLVTNSKSDRKLRTNVLTAFLLLALLSTSSWKRDTG